MSSIDRDEARGLVDDFVKEIRKARNVYSVNVSEYQLGRTIIELPKERQSAVAVEAVRRQAVNMCEFAARKSLSSSENLWSDSIALKALISALLRKNLPFQADDINSILDSISQASGYVSWQISLAGILRAVETFITENGLAESVSRRLRKLQGELRRAPDYAESRQASTRLSRLLDDQPIGNSAVDFTTGEPWTLVLRERTRGSSRSAWTLLLSHCSTASQSKPTKKWLGQASAFVKEIGPDEFAEVSVAVLGMVGNQGPPEKKSFAGMQFELDPTMVHDAHSDLLRGLVWCASLVPKDELIAAVGDAAEICFKKIPGAGPRAPKIGNACLIALAQVSSPAAVAQLSRLKAKAKHTSIRNQIGKALDTAAVKTGLSIEQMEEMSVPTLGLSEVGTLRHPIGEFTAELQIGKRGRAELSWQRSGKTQSTVPTSVKYSHADELRALQRTAKELDKLVAAQRHRLEGLFRVERSWTYADFRKRYLDHPIIGTLARGLIWQFENDSKRTTGIWRNGEIVSASNRTVTNLKDETRVSLWHPLSANADSVQAWRHWLDEKECASR